MNLDDVPLDEETKHKIIDSVLRAETIKAALEEDLSWQRIGEILGISRQAAQQWWAKHGEHDDKN